MLLKNKFYVMIFLILLSCCFLFVKCAKKEHEESKNIPNEVTEDIQAGIEKYIDEKAKEGKGYFRFVAGEKQYLFKLVRIHTEYLAKLGPGSYFACVDLVDTKGDVYDVDFFLKGDPENMYVTETTLHKLNGIPFYTWKMQSDKTWVTVPIENASESLLGVIRGQDKFEFKYFAQLPDIKKEARVWIPVPKTDDYQQISIIEIKAPGKYREIEEKKHGNKIFFFDLGPSDSKKVIEIVYRVTRKEKSAYPSKNERLSKYLKSDNLVPINNNFQNIAKDVIKGKKGELVHARAIYDHVIEKMQYIKYGDGWGKGDAVHACDMRTGNCTDYHAYFIALARAVGIPARFAIGAAIPSSRDEGGISGYHCWVEFHAEGKWWPIDISEADKYSSLATYYFGHHPANRIEFSQGRDLLFEPGPKSGAVNFLAYPLFEIEGEQKKIVTKFSFKRL